MALYLAEAAGPLRPPIPRHSIVEDRVYFSVKLIDIDRLEAVLQALLLGLEARNRCLMLAPFVGVTGVESLSDPIEDLTVEPESPQHFTELALEYLLTDVRLSAWAFVAGAMIVDVALFFDLANQRATSMPAGDQS
jgi:hypothetical protein